MASQLVVLGMHRSGTSLAARVVAHLGCHIGTDSELIPSNSANPQGYYEREDVIELNKALLQEQGADWIAPQSYASDSVSKKLDRAFSRKAGKVIRQLAESSPFAIKDPRLVITLNNWKKVLSDPVYLLCVRHPVEVAQSLLRRNGIPLPVGLALWHWYNCQMLEQTRGEARLVVHFNRLMESPQDELLRLRRGLTRRGIKLSNDLSGARELISAELYTQRLCSEALGCLSAEQQVLYEYLSARSLGTRSFSKANVEQLLNVHEQGRRLSAKYEALIEASSEQRRQFENGRDKLQEQLEEYRKRLEAAAEKFTTAQDRTERYQKQYESCLQELETTRGKLAAMQQSLANSLQRQESLQDAVTKKNAAEQRNQQLQARIEYQLEEVESLRSKLAVVNGKLHHSTEQEGTLREQVDHLRQRQQAYSDRESRSLQREQALRAQVQELKQRLLTYSDEKASSLQREQTLREQSEKLAKDLTALREKIDGLQEARLSDKRREESLRKRSAQSRAKAEGLLVDKQALKQTIAEQTASMDKLRSEKQAVLKEKNELKYKLEEQSEKLKQKQQEQRGQAEALQAAKASIARQAALISKIRAQRLEVEQSLKSVGEKRAGMIADLQARLGAEQQCRAQLKASKQALSQTIDQQRDKLSAERAKVGGLRQSLARAEARIERQQQLIEKLRTKVIKPVKPIKQAATKAANSTDFQETDHSRQGAIK